MISRRAMLAMFVPPGAITVALRVRDGAVIECSDPVRAREISAAPGSAVKPWTLLSLGDRSLVRCRGRLSVAGRRLDCAHVSQIFPISAENALAWSCNSWFASHAKRVDPPWLLRMLLRAGADATLASTPDELVLQALGLEKVRFTPMAMAKAYLQLASSRDLAIRKGLERAVSEGTAQLAKTGNVLIAGKTGTSKEGSWFGGFAPARKPEVAVSVYVPGGRGGSDAAPIAREVFARCLRGSLHH